MHKTFRIAMERKREETNIKHDRSPELTLYKDPYTLKQQKITEQHSLYTACCSFDTTGVILLNMPHVNGVSLFIDRL